MSSSLSGWKALSTTSTPPESWPTGRSSHALFGVKKKGSSSGDVVMFGGERIAREAVDGATWICSSDSTWSTLPSTEDAVAPRPRFAMASASYEVDGELRGVIFGGRTGIGMGQGALDDTFVFEAGTGWRAVTCPLSPTPRSYHAMVGNGQYVFLFGGCAEERLNDLWLFDGVAERWHSVKMAKNSHQPPVSRGGPVLFVSRMKNGELAVCVLFGFDGKKELSSGVVGMLHFSNNTDSWEINWLDDDSSMALFDSSNGVPIGRSVLAGAPVDNQRFFVFGGEKSPSAKGHEGAGEFHRDAWLLTCQTDTEKFPRFRWQQLSSSSGDEESQNGPEPRGWLSSCFVPSGSSPTMFLFGGLNTENKRLDDGWFFHLTC
uniref:Uncharacterized protein n=1 Tax=Paramoeba aestuarina TaxID=180227 RepID=A0A7S4KTM0_9EUKA|mmetsp:Transcript_25182/g.39273  ORF Transcript_25182/g.39273 Transcript_25182/m.39273 type:complete len:375 (+) Transcript_25182:111-1235(+)